MAAAADAVLDADDDILAFLLEQSFVLRTGDFVHGFGQVVAVGLQFGKFFLEIALSRAHVGEAAVEDLFGFIGGLGGGGNLFLCRFDLFHQLELPVVELDDGFLAHLDLVGQRAVFLVLFRLELLDGILVDELFLGLDVQLQFLALGFDLFGFVFRGLQRAQAGGQLGLEFRPLRADAGEFVLHFQKLSVAILEDEKFFNDGQHGANVC